MIAYWFYLLLLLAQPSLQQRDPLDNFCRRFGHQSAVVDRRVYLDGGLINWNPISQNPINYTNTWLLYGDLDTSPAGVGVPQLHANLSKNASLPDVAGGVLWADEVNKRFYVYGGNYHDTPNTYSLLSYDILNDQWDSFGVPSTPIFSVAYGAGVGISALGEGYVLGGWLSNSSVPGWSGEPLATSTLIRYDMDARTWTNNTGPDNSPRAEGVMVYIPAGRDGLLVHFGGLTTSSNNTIQGSPMSKIDIYDIASSSWYTQTAVGEVPEMRRRFCAGATWAPDQSSYNIYLYGGAGFDANETGFDDVYILTLPSFTWIKWWPSEPGVGRPHNSLTCNVIDGAQMLIVGGTFPLSDDCDSSGTWGIHNLDLGKQNSNNAMWNDYQPNITSYVVPPEIISVVGGSSRGGATATAPAAGFDNRDLSVYFTQRATVASRTPSLPPSSSNTSPKLSTGAIVGIAIGGAAVLLGLLFGVFCCLQRRKRQRTASQSPGFYPNGVQETQEYPQSPHSPYYQQEHSHFLPSQHDTSLSTSNQVTSIAELSGNSLPYPIQEVKKYDSPPPPNDASYTLHGNWDPESPTQPYRSPVSPNSLHNSARTEGTTELSGSNPRVFHDSELSPPTVTTSRTRKPTTSNENHRSPS